MCAIVGLQYNTAFAGLIDDMCSTCVGCVNEDVLSTEMIGCHGSEVYGC